MRILLVTESYGWSGGAAQTLWLAEGLRRRGHSVWIACEPGGEVFRRATDKKIPLIPMRIRGDADLSAVWRLVRAIRKHSIQILHAQHPKAHGVSLLATIALGHRIPLLVTRRVSFPVNGNPFSRWKYTSSFIDRFIAVSDGIRQVLKEGGVAQERVAVVYSGVDPESFQRLPAAEAAVLRATLKLSEVLPVIMKVANFSSWKGQSVFLEAAALLLASGHKAQCVLVGRDTDGAAVREQIERLNLGTAVHTLGFRSDISQLLSIADISINCAVAGEGLSGALRESLALSVPVVASDVAGNRELVLEGKTGRLVPPNNPQALAEALAWTLDNKEEARRLAAAGRARVLGEFTVDHMVEKTESLYGPLLRTPNP